MSADLERRYRLLLLAFPRRYRAQRGEEMLTTLMEAARPGQRWPSAPDVADVLTHALRIRLGVPARARRGVLAPAAGVGLSLAATLSLVALLFGELPVWGHDPGLNASQFGFGPFETTGVFAYALVVAAWICFLDKQAPTARVFAGLACLAVLSSYVASDTMRARPNLTVLATLVVCLVPVLLTGPPWPTRRSFVAAIPVVGAMLGLAAFSGFATGHPHHWDPRDRFYTDQLGLVGRLHPVVPALALVVLAGGAVAAVRLRRREVWSASTLVIVPAVVVAFGGGDAGRAVQDRLRGNTPLIDMVIVVVIAAVVEVALARRWPASQSGHTAE